jgi:hypothetical protein
MRATCRSRKIQKAIRMDHEAILRNIRHALFAEHEEEKKKFKAAVREARERRARVREIGAKIQATWHIESVMDMAKPSSTGRSDTEESCLVGGRGPIWTGPLRTARCRRSEWQLADKAIPNWPALRLAARLRSTVVHWKSRRRRSRLFGRAQRSLARQNTRR